MIPKVFQKMAWKSLPGCFVLGANLLASVLGDGIWSQWTNWSACSVTCGTGGVQVRSRTCLYPDPAAPGKTCTGYISMTQTCTAVQDCPVLSVDGVWGAWSAWSACSVSCGDGFQIRRRKCEFPLHAIQGDYCPGSGTDTQSCNVAQCAVVLSVDGVWGAWSAWSACSVSCGDGFQIRRRKCEFPLHAIQGDYCPGSGTDTQSCNVAQCAVASVDGVWGSWFAWSPCSMSCGGGVQIRRRKCEFPLHAIQGAYCSGRGTDTQSCNTVPCSVVIGR